MSLMKKTAKHKVAVATLFLMTLWMPQPAAYASSDTVSQTSESEQKQAYLTKVVAGTGAVGELNGHALSASFRQPMGVVVLPEGAAFVADSANHVIRKIAEGTVATSAGFTVSRDAKGFPVGTLLDGPLDQSMFQHPQGMDVDREGNLYVADSGNHAIRKITPQGVMTVAGDGVQGYQDGQGKEARFHSPGDVAVAPDGTIYVADTLNHAIRKITATGQVTTLNSLSDRMMAWTSDYVDSVGDFRDGKLSEAKFNEPSAIALDAKGNLYVSDTGNQRIRYIDLQNETVTTVAGEASVTYMKDSPYAEGGYTDGAAATARFQAPRGIAVTAEGGLVIADSLNQAVRYLHDGQVTTWVSGFDLPIDVDVDSQGNVWVVDAFAQTIRQIHLSAD